MSLEEICMEQEDIIERQAALIRGLLNELMQFRSLDNEEQRLLDDKEVDNND